MTVLSPDLFAAQCIDDLTSDGYDALRTVWPAAWRAVSEVFAIEDEMDDHAVELCTVPLAQLVQAYNNVDPEVFRRMA